MLCEFLVVLDSHTPFAFPCACWETRYGHSPHHNLTRADLRGSERRDFQFNDHPSGRSHTSKAEDRTRRGCEPFLEPRDRRARVSRFGAVCGPFVRILPVFQTRLRADSTPTIRCSLGHFPGAFVRSLRPYPSLGNSAALHLRL